VQDEVLPGNAIWQMLRLYAVAAGVHGIAPHDCRRRAAKPWHASVQTNECDGIKLEAPGAAVGARLLGCVGVGTGATGGSGEDVG
jgi:hypothetical protein